MAGGPMDTEGNKAYAKSIDEKHRKENLKQFENYKPIPVSDSDFHHHGIDALRAMIENANPEALETAGDHWRASADRLAGQDGSGGIRKAFMDAIDHASNHWQGKAADAFRREAAEVLKKIDRTYKHARNVESTLIGTRSSGPESGIAHNLRQAKKTMAGIKDPGKVESAFNSSGDDSQFHKDMVNQKMDAKMALEANRDKLSLSKERQVEAVIVMEELAYHYRLQKGKVTVPPGSEPPGGRGNWPAEPGDYPPVPSVNMPVVGGTRPKPTSVTPHGSKGGSGYNGLGGGVNIQPSNGPVRTGLDSLQGGTVAPVGPGLTGGGVNPPAGGTGGGSGGGGSTGGFIAPLPYGKTGGTGGGGSRSAPGGRGGVLGGSRSGGAGAGRTGIPGGIGGGAGAVGSGAGRGVVGRGAAQARKPGGVVGAPGSLGAGAKQGGAGLHRSAGGSQAMGGAAAHGRPKDKEKTKKERPDYLVEDEETWTPQRNVSPRVIE
ncbi:WXG100 family type VII secretion target [Streptomyces chrestomyceticus]|uniref:WXG100 family type VII secretion target n=1 Tax=Streptomyces chrestomyceticus TaxID=68185 RepID=UPI0036C521D4